MGRYPGKARDRSGRSGPERTHDDLVQGVVAPVDVEKTSTVLAVQTALQERQELDEPTLVLA